MSDVATTPRRRLRYRVEQWLIRNFVRCVFGLRYSGVENLPATGGVLLAANHKSYLDPPIVGAGLSRELRYFAKRQLFEIPILGAIIRDSGGFPVDREAFDRRAVATAMQIVRSGGALLVFPEGTRMRMPGLGEPKEGIALLALESGVPVVPVHVASAWEPRRTLFRRIPIQVRYGPPLVFESLPRGSARRAQYSHVSQQIFAAIAALAPPTPPELSD